MTTLLAIMGGLIASIIGMVLLIKGYFKLTENRPATTASDNIFEKKYPHYDLQRYRNTFFRVGMAFAMLMVIFAFSWTTYDSVPTSLGEGPEEDWTEITPPPTPPLPPPPPPPPVVPEITVVEDDIIVEDDPIIELEEIDPDDFIDPVIAEPEPEPDKAPEFFTIVEKMPKFPGGEKALMEYLGDIKSPRHIVDMGVSDKVYVRFLVNEQGEVEGVNIVRGQFKDLNEAVAKHISNMPNWSPGEQRGKAVKVQYIVPMSFEFE